MSSNTIAFVTQWQTLIGAALGPFLAVCLAAIGYGIRLKIEKLRGIKDAIRTIDTSIIRTLNSLYSARLNLEIFLKRLQVIIKEIEGVSDPMTFVLTETNFPGAVGLFVNPILPELQTGSNYLHNQLMFYDAGLEKDNEALQIMKESFSTILRKNELSVTQNQPIYQRQLYAENLKALCFSIEEFIKHLKEGCKVGQQIKIYNEKLGRARSKTIKEFENIAKPFTNREKWALNIDRVNKLIEPEVDVAIKKAEDGLEKMRGTAIAANFAILPM